MRTATILPLLGLLLLVGCSGGSKVTKGAPKPEKSEAERLEELRNLVEKTTDSVKPGAYEIAKPGTKGWKATSDSMPDLGAAVDERLANAQNVLCRAVLSYDDPDAGKMVYRPEIRIADSKTFDVRYVIPETKGSISWVRADGKSRAINFDAAWKRLPPVGSGSKKLTEKDVVGFPERFPQIMFGKYTDGMDVWGPLFQAWNDGVGGYKSTIEDQAFKVGGESRRVYRVTAKTEQNGGAEIEISIDAKALRPLSVRSKGKRPDGSEYKMLWVAQWLVGGKLDRSTFQLPKDLPVTPSST